MSFFFTIKEGLKGLTRARLASFLTITTVVLSLFLIGFFVALFINVDYWVGQKRKNIEIEVFLEPIITNNQILKIKQKLNDLPGVSKVDFISKEQAAKRFKAEFGQDVQSVLGTNPLPPSFVIYLEPQFRNATSIRSISESIKKMEGVTDVVYPFRVLTLIDRYTTIIYLILGVLGLVLIAITVILIHNSIRLIIYARKEIIEIMKLVGATHAFIRRPFLVEGLFYGLVGGFLADALLYGLIHIIKSWIYHLVVFPIEVYVFLLALGLAVGFISSKISINKHLNSLL